MSVSAAQLLSNCFLVLFSCCGQCSYCTRDFNFPFNFLSRTHKSFNYLHCFLCIFDTDYLQLLYLIYLGITKNNNTLTNQLLSFGLDCMPAFAFILQVLKVFRMDAEILLKRQFIYPVKYYYNEMCKMILSKNKFSKY